MENLEWINHSDNNIHANKIGLRKSNRTHLIHFDKNIDNLQNEKWIPVKDFPDYLISSCGRVRSLKNNKDILLRPSVVNGYYKVSLTQNNKVYDKLISYLVYCSFNNITLKEKYVIDHIDGDKLNNNLSNLRYISRSENTKAAYYTQKTQTNIRSVVCYKDNIKIGTYPSCSEAARQLGCNSSSISKCRRGIYKHHHGYIFKYQ